MILQPLLDPLFDPLSLGYRPQRGRRDALALAEMFTQTQQRRVWVVEDLKDAFQHVPISRLLQVMQQLLPDDGLIQLLRHVLPGRRLLGLRQGGSLSPLMLNVYLNHFLDRPWRRDHPDWPMIRVADDMLVLVRSERQAVQARAALIALLQPAGMPLKGTTETAIHDLDQGDAADWLGFSIAKAPRGLSVNIADRAWKSLANHLTLAHTKPDSTIRPSAR